MVFLLCSIATALAPNIAAFFVFRVLTALSATAFLVIGPAVISDLFHPTERATGMQIYEVLIQPFCTKTSLPSTPLYV